MFRVSSNVLSNCASFVRAYVTSNSHQSEKAFGVVETPNEECMILSNFTEFRASSIKHQRMQNRGLIENQLGDEEMLPQFCTRYPLVYYTTCPVLLTCFNLLYSTHRNCRRRLDKQHTPCLHVYWTFSDITYKMSPFLWSCLGMKDSIWTS